MPIAISMRAIKKARWLTRQGKTREGSIFHYPSTLVSGENVFSVGAIPIVIGMSSEMKE